MQKIKIEQHLKNKDELFIKYVSKYFSHFLKEEYDGRLLPDYNNVVNVLKKHLDLKSNIGILGDFDTDGITATTSFYIGLKTLFPYINVFYKVPERDDGHGISKKNIDFLYSKNVKLIFSCDNGSNDKENINYAKSLGIDIIITDHHDIREKNIDYLLVNCMREDSKYPHKDLCGCGVVYKLLSAFEKDTNLICEPLGDIKEYIQCLTVIATIVDMVNYNEENYYIVDTYRKLFESKKIPNVLKKIMKLTNYNKKDGKWFGWGVGPMFNVAGRLSRANQLVDILINGDNYENLDELLCYFQNLNEYRKELSEKWSSFFKDKIISSEHIHIAKHTNIPSGIKRLVANTYSNNKICFCGKIENGIVDCSVVNSYGINLIDFLEDKHYTTNVGGHYGAFGYSYIEKHENEFINDLNEYINTVNINNNLQISENVNFDKFSIEFIENIKEFVWGKNVDEPIFNSQFIIKKINILKDKHTKLELQTVTGKSVVGLKWNSILSLEKEQLVTLNYKLDINEWMGKKTIKIIIL